MSENESKTLQMTLTRTVESPLPLASEIEGYEKVLPGSADRILALVEKQSQHRQDCEKRELELAGRNDLIAIIFAFIFAMSVLICSVILILNNHSEAAAILAGCGVGATVAAFLQKRKSDNPE